MGILFRDDHSPSSKTNSYVAVVHNNVNGTDAIHEYYADNEPYDNTPTICQKAVVDSGYTTPRGNPTTVKVILYRLNIEKGKLVRNQVVTHQVSLPFASLTSEQYNAELDKILDSVPEAFRRFISSSAYERGHSAGYEEVLMIAQGLATELEDPIKEFKKQVLEEAL